jgi:hypothetical protein
MLILCLSDPEQNRKTESDSIFKPPQSKNHYLLIKFTKECVRIITANSFFEKKSLLIVAEGLRMNEIVASIVLFLFFMLLKEKYVKPNNF